MFVLSTGSQRFLPAARGHDKGRINGLPFIGLDMRQLGVMITLPSTKTAPRPPPSLIMPIPVRWLLQLNWPPP
jgi:hypothetical protein